MKLLIFKLPKNHPIAGPNNMLKDMKLRRAASDGFLGPVAQIHAQKEDKINSLFGGNDYNKSPFDKK